MGKVEKLVVLTVLFLTAIVIAVTLRKSDGKAEQGTDPLNSAEHALLAQTPGGVQPQAGDGAGPAALLSSNLGTNPTAQQPAVNAPALSPAPAVVAPTSVGLVKNTAGLRPGLTAELMVYDWKSGDTWSSVAQSIYGDARYETQLRATNADVKQPKAGEPILVPTVELSGFDAPKSAGGALNANELAGPKADAGAGSSAGSKALVDASAPKGGGKTHTVKAGDSLSSIAKQYYGSAAKWKVIADANKSTLKDPNKLKVGMKLSIP
jgi:nucleoid-associated protein YgaU